MNTTRTPSPTPIPCPSFLVTINTTTLCRFTPHSGGGVIMRRVDAPRRQQKTEPPQAEDGSVIQSDGTWNLAGSAHKLAPPRVAQAGQAEAHEDDGGGLGDGCGRLRC